MIEKLILAVVLLLGWKALAEEMRWESSPDHTLVTQIGIQVPSLGMSIKGAENQVPELQYKPNSPTRTYLGLSYDNIGFSMAFANPVPKDKETYYGTSTVTDYHLIFYGVQHSYGFFYQNYSGYYIDNSQSVNSNLQDDQPRLQRSDLTTQHYGMEYYYTLDPEKFSLESAYGHSTRQIITGSSWVGILTIANTRISADRSIIPSSFASSYGDLKYFEGGDFLSVDPGLGYGGTLAYGDFYLAGLATLSLGLQRQEFQLGNSKIDHWVGNNTGNVKVSFGYNGKKYFSGFQVEGLVTNIPINQVVFSANQYQALLFVGLRTFDFPIPWLDRFNDWFESKNQ
jgi:hypothetical protein